MFNIIIEIITATVYGGILYTISGAIEKNQTKNEPGVKLVQFGLSLLFFSFLIDITDNFPSLNYLVIIGDTNVEAFLEKLVGHALGSILLFFGLKRWLPNIVELRETKNKLNQYNVYLENEVDRRTSELTYQVTHDALTSLFNRSYITSILNEKVHCGFCALFYMDLNNFKNINDTYGHHFGDCVLQSVASKLKKFSDERTILAGRLSGDEFVLVVKNLHKDLDIATKEVVDLANSIIIEMDAIIKIEDQKTSHPCSIGITLYDNNLPHDTLFKQADLALYDAKSNKKTSQTSTFSFFSKELEDNLNEKNALIKELKTALINEDLFLHYQPQIDMHSNLIGVEALLRWEHPTRGSISPDVFISIAENEGFIDEIGRYVLCKAIDELNVHLSKNNSVINLSVNISPLHFSQNDFIEQIKHILPRNKNKSLMLTLELTENTLIKDPKGASERIVALNEINVATVLDDFGKGYSSLRYIQEIPFKSIKIDRSFVKDIDKKISDLVIIEAMIKMTSSIGMTVIAEGIETNEQYELLKALGCDYYKGYLFGKPSPIQDIMQFI